VSDVYRNLQGEEHPMPPKTAMLELFDLAVASYTDGTTSDFRILVHLYFDPLREHLVKVLEGSP
jgi:hypothetical protein